MGRKLKTSTLTRSRNPCRKLFPSLFRREQEENSPEPMKMEASQERGRKDKLTRSLNGSIRALEGEGNERKFELSFSSEEPYTRWFGVEILDHSAGAVDLTRLNEIGVLLFNHDRDEVLGKIERAWLEGDRGKAIVVFDDDDTAEPIYQKVMTGTLKGVSVGYRVKTWEVVKPGENSSNGKFTGPCEVATSWEPYEISIVSVPADPTVGVGRELETEIHDTRKQAPSLAQRQLRVNINQLL